MNESAVRLEEQIISLFSEWETEICRGWILKKMGRHLLVYPLYGQEKGTETVEYVMAEPDITEEKSSPKQEDLRNGFTE